MNEQPPTILIIDDNVENRYTSSRYLKREGFAVIEAGTGAEGIQKARENPALIMLDIQLPDTTGYDVCRAIRKDPSISFIPILHTSATYTESRDRTEGLAGGADGYLVAPIDPEELIATVKALLRIRKAEAAATKLAVQWNTTFEAVNDGICLIDTEGKIERANRALEEILNHPGLEGSDLISLLKEKGAEPQFLKEILVNETSVTETLRIAEKFYLVTCNQAASGLNKFSGFVCVFSDVTAIKRAEQTLQNLNEELETRVQQRTAALNEANAQLESFCYSVAHDLRAPIRTMQGFSDILIEDHSTQLDADGMKYLQRIHKGAQRMDRLIQDLLRYSRLSREEIILESTNLSECVNAVLQDNEKDFNQAKASFVINIPSDVCVWAQGTTLRQAITNVLSNAVKFMGQGTDPKVEIFYQEHKTPCLFIKDNGIGIDAEHLTKIFDIFERIHSDTYAGTGIGLAIVRRAMERMSGNVSVQSTPHQGTTFCLEFKQGAIHDD